jgi:hypothetical protein
MNGIPCGVDIPASNGKRENRQGPRQLSRFGEPADRQEARSVTRPRPEAQGKIDAA